MLDAALDPKDDTLDPTFDKEDDRRLVVLEESVPVVEEQDVEAAMGPAPKLFALVSSG